MDGQRLHARVRGLLVDGRGAGRSLRAAADGVPVHLDTDAERNVAWYERFGFTVTERIHVMPGAPPSWGMLARP